ncbi:unnamed protein product [Symbiodinium microadriaticum]|nr:unnamed protein product [Symbiodinium microadriaticum]
MAEPAPAEEDAPKHPRKTYKPHGNDLRFQVDVPPKKQAGLQDDSLDQAFKKCCKTWMQREDTEVGQLATPWTVRGKAVQALAADDETVTPVRVARKIAAQEQARKATDRKQQPCIAEVSRSEWEAFVSQHSDGTGLLQIVHTLPSGSFVGFLPRMLQELKSLHLQGRMAEIYLAADATFDVEADGFKCLGFAVLPSRLPGARHVQDLEHMLKNLAKSSLKTVTGEEIRVPRLCTRPLRVVASYIHTVALLPSVSLFLVCLGTLPDRIKTGWGEEPFHDFFVQQYLYKASIQEAVYGVSEVLTGRWWYGMSSHLACGHAPSMQTPEMAHRQVKRALTDAPGRSLLTVLQSLKEAGSLWTSDRSAEQDSFTLLTPNGHTSVSQTAPLHPGLLHAMRQVEVLWQSLQTKRLDAVRDLLGRSGAILEVEGGRNADQSIDRRCLSLRMSPRSLCLPRQLLVSFEFCRRSERANPRCSGSSGLGVRWLVGSSGSLGRVPWVSFV